MIRFGVHNSLRDGLCGALEEAQKLGCESMQIFTRSPRMWKMKPPADEELARFRELRKELGIHPLVIHTPYLPNLATSNSFLYGRSRESFINDLVIAEKMQADYFVIHPGSYSEGGTAEEGIGRIVAAVKEALREAPGKVCVLFENVAGGGRRIGSSVEEIAKLLDGVGDERRAGVCIDTAHALGAGYDLASRTGVDRFLKECDASFGLERIHVIHFNDSMAPLGSHKDRHQHLGKGHIGAPGFRHFAFRIKSVAAAGILETPKDTPDADKRNLRLLLTWRKSSSIR